MNALQRIGGNVMVWLHEIEPKCSKCHGTGQVPSTIKDIQQRIEDVYCVTFGRVSFRGMMAIYRDWKKCGRVMGCDRCGE